MRYSDRYLEIYEICERLAENSKSFFEFEKALKAKEIPYEEVELASGKELLIFTGSSGYDVAGITVRMDGRQIVLEEM